jgi:hypothetical protein
MEWLNIHRSTVEGEAMQDASAEAVRAWLFLQAYCVGQENGGRIEGAKGWNDRKWLKQCGLSLEAVHQASGLWYWDGEDLHIEFYPLNQEAKFIKNRQTGATGGRRSGEVRRQKNLQHRTENEAPAEARVEADGSTKNEATVEALTEARVERKVKERKVKKGKEREGAREENSIPTETDVRTWAVSAGVDPEFAVQKWEATFEAHGWWKNDELIDWRRRFKRYWLEDEVEWQARKKNRAQKSYPDGAPEKPAGWKEGDERWWWGEEIGLIERTLHGALLGGQEAQANRLREILKIRKQ